MTARWSEFARGWPVLAAAFLGIAIGVSSLYFYSLGVFIKPMAAEFGWTRGQASLGALVGTAAAALAAVPTGRLVDRYGSRPVALGSLALLAIGFVALGTLTSGLASFLALAFALSLVTAGSSPIALTRLVVAGFVHARGLALGIVLAGTGLGAILVPALLTPYIAAHGWRNGYLALAAVILVVGPVVALILARCREDVRTDRRPEIPIATLAREPAFWLLMATFLLAAAAVLGTVVQFVPMLSDWGLPPAAAGGLAALIGIAAIVGRLIAGLLMDRFPAYAITVLMFLCAAAGLVVLGLGGARFAAPGALITGFAIGAEVDLMAFLVARHFPPRAYGKTYGAIYTAFLIGGAVGPALSGFLKDATGDYRVSLFVAAALLAGAATVAWRLRRTSAWTDRDEAAGRAAEA
ncbi:MAG TPA: MFS transporter [Sphingomonas sp.]